MEGLAALVKYIYSAFILRDFLAKIVPGSVVLVCTYWCTTDTAHLWKDISSLTWPFVVMLTSISWIVGFAVQTLGCWLRISPTDPFPFVHLSSKWLWPADKDINQDSLDFRVLSAVVNGISADEDFRSLRERQAVIMEACGNLASAMLWGGVLVASRSVLDRLEIAKQIYVDRDYLAAASAMVVFLMLWNRSLFQRNRVALIQLAIKNARLNSKQP